MLLALGLAGLLALPSVAGAADTTVLASREPGLAGAPNGYPNGYPYGFSDDGRYVLLEQYDNEADTSAGLLRRDLRTGEAVLVNRADGPDGAVIGDLASTVTTISADGRYVMFAADPDPDRDDSRGTLYRRDVEAGRTIVVGRADGPGGAPVPAYGTDLSADGSRVVFITDVAGVSPDAPQAGYRVWVRDIASGRTLLASRGDGPNGTPSTTLDEFELPDAVISGNGATVAWSTGEPVLPGIEGRQVYARDLDAGRTELVSRASGPEGAASATGFPYGLDASFDGQRILFGGDPFEPAPDPDTPREDHLFVRDRVTNDTLVASRADGAEGAIASTAHSASLSADGSTVAFVSDDPALAASEGEARWREQTYSRALTSHETTLESRGQYGRPSVDGYHFDTSISADGRSVAFFTNARNLVADFRGGLFSYGYFIRGDLPPTSLPDSEPVAALGYVCEPPFCETPAGSVLDARGSFDVEAPLAGWELDFGDGSALLTGTGDDLPDPQHDYPPGTFTARLTVTDTSGQRAVVTRTVGVPIGDPRIRTKLVAAPLASMTTINGVTARLLTESGNEPVAGRTITFRTSDNSLPICTAVTEDDGRATCTTQDVLLAIAGQGFRAKFHGDEQYRPSATGRAFP